MGNGLLGASLQHGTYIKNVHTYTYAYNSRKLYRSVLPICSQVCMYICTVHSITLNITICTWFEVTDQRMVRDGDDDDDYYSNSSKIMLMTNEEYIIVILYVYAYIRTFWSMILLCIISFRWMAFFSSLSFVFISTPDIADYIYTYVHRWPPLVIYLQHMHAHTYITACVQVLYNHCLH